MTESGLVSVSFRNLLCEEIITLAKSNGLTHIEWGGDIHIPAGNTKKADEIYKKTTEAGLQTAAYGSYFKLGEYTDYIAEFKKVLETAVTLHAPVIRIWAGTEPSSKVASDERKQLVLQAKEVAKLCSQHGITVCFECHRNTLTDDFHSSLLLMNEINMSNVKMYFQPNEERNFEYNKKALEELLPYVVNTHVFNWPEPGIRKHLNDARNEWAEYLNILSKDEKMHCCMLEFMPDDRTESLKEEAATLNEIIKTLNNR